MIVVVSLSGGKDSSCVSAMLQELGVEHRRVFADTGWEHPSTYEHLEYLESVLGPIDRVASIPELEPELVGEVQELEEKLNRGRPSAFIRWSTKKAMFPGRIKRWCTEKLKSEPLDEYLEALAKEEDIINARGIRAAESEKRRQLGDREPHPTLPNVEIWRPILELSEQDVIDYLRGRGIRPAPLYLRGAGRVGCWPCIMASKPEIAMLEDARVDALEELEGLVKRLRQKKGGDMQPALFMAKTKSAVGCVPIRQTVDWARTERGGVQMSLLPGPAGRPCERWGLCER